MSMSIDRIDKLTFSRLPAQHLPVETIDWPHLVGCWPCRGVETGTKGYYSQQRTYTRVARWLPLQWVATLPGEKCKFQVVRQLCLGSQLCHSTRRSWAQELYQWWVNDGTGVSITATLQTEAGHPHVGYICCTLCIKWCKSKGGTHGGYPSSMEKPIFNSCLTIWRLVITQIIHHC